jgi:hypothetical protein
MPPEQEQEDNFSLMGNTGDTNTEVTPPEVTTPVDEQENQSITNPHEWAKGLEEGLTKTISLHKFKDIGSLAKAYVELEKNQGKSPFPGPKSTEEERIAFFRKAGVPDVDKYSLDGKKFGLSEDVEKGIKELASKSGIHPSALESLLGFIKEKGDASTSALTDQAKALREEQINVLKKDYGTAFDKYLNLGVEVAKKVYTKEELGLIKQNGLNDNPLFVKLLMERAKSMFGEEMIEDDHTKKNLIATPEAVDRRIQEILGDKDYQDQTSARHASLVQEMEKLFITKSKNA